LHSDSFDNRPESYLLSEARYGNRAAFGELCQRHSPQTLRVIKGIVRNREDAQDALQEATLKAFTHLPQFDGRSRFSTWFTRIGINAALMILRKDRAHRRVPINVDNELPADDCRQEIADPTPRIDMVFARHEEWALLKKAISNIRPALRTAIEIRYLRECSIGETALALGVSLTAAKARLHHARAELRKLVVMKDSFCSRRNIVYQGSLPKSQEKQEATNDRSYQTNKGLPDLPGRQDRRDSGFKF
jgi:RNA polymerase sigma-70 factor (ECF subfamily)